jgi:alpha-beta hydrolase superfamily lysophospholipase
MYAHGTGGSANSMRNDHTAGRLAGRGIAAISIDQPLHGIRDEGMTFDVDLMSFNFLNGDAFRANFRQASIDVFSLTRFVKESLRVPASVSPTGAQIEICDDRVAFFGHSHGGLSGALALPFEGAIDDWVLSGAGGGFGVTMLERKDIIDFSNLVQIFLAITKTESFSELHPGIMLVQTLADISDPVNYAERWNHRTVGRDPASVLMTSGEHDAATPYRTAIALAAAARLQITSPVAVPAPEFDWLGQTPAASPLHANANGQTAAFAQWTNDIDGANIDTHFVIFHRPEAIEAGNHFLETSLYDFDSVSAMRVPTLVRDVATNAR